MSSILDALRKVEAEKTKKKADLREIEEVLAEKDLIVPEEGEPAPTARGPKRAVMLVGLVAVVVVFGVAAFFVHNALRGALPGRPVVSRPAIQQPGEAASPAEPSETAVSTSARASEPTPARPEPAEPTEIAPEPTAPETEIAAQALATPSEGPPAKKPAVRPDLRINILRPPSEQFPTGLAVVNGKKVGVGDRVGGAKIIKIQEDGVVFEYGDDLFPVKF
jgi:hypothetical protein